MMNKGLELIEACWLFDTTPARIEVVIHPQSVIHSMVDYVDGSVLAQLGNPDMRTPIAHALAWPGAHRLGRRAAGSVQHRATGLRSTGRSALPMPASGAASCRAGDSAPAVLNAANEVAVAAFLDKRIRYPEIASMIDEVLNLEPVVAVSELETVFEIDARARALAEQWLGRNGR